MAEIKVDPDKLELLARELTGLRAEFAGLEERVEDYEPAVGHRKLADELHATATNWSKKRTQLLADLEELAHLAEHAAQHYRCLDAEVAASIRRVSDPG
jgi:chromosome segregation ATPase